MFIAPLSQYGQSYYLKKVNTSQLLLPQYQNTYPRGPESMYINWNIPFQTQIYLVNVPLNVNIVGTYFNAVIVKVEKYFLFSDLL